MRASFVFSEVFTGLRRNVTMTIAMILTTAISLALLGVGVLVMRSVDLTKEQYLGNIEVNIYMTNDVSANDKGCTQQPCEGLKQSLEKDPAVETVVFESRDEAYKRFKQIFEEQPELVELARPEALPAALRVKLIDPEQSETIATNYKDKPGIDKIVDQGVFLDNLIDGLNFFRDLAFGVSVFLLIAALLLIANMIQVSAFTRRTEVGIMRLVGATRWYTQLPFLLEAVFSGLIGAIVAILALLGLQAVSGGGLLAELSSSGIIQVPSIWFTVFTVAPVLTLVSILISAITGYATLRLYVRH